MKNVLRRWWPIAALLLLLAMMLGKLWWGEGGWPQARQLQRTVEEQRRENARLQQRNDALSAEVQDLKSGETAVEERARSELGMVKPGEIFYRVVEPHSDATPGDDAAVATPPATTDDAVPTAPPRATTAAAPAAPPRATTAAATPTAPPLATPGAAAVIPPSEATGDGAIAPEPKP